MLELSIIGRAAVARTAGELRRNHASSARVFCATASQFPAQSKIGHLEDKFNDYTDYNTLSKQDKSRAVPIQPPYFRAMLQSSTLEKSYRKPKTLAMPHPELELTKSVIIMKFMQPEQEIVNPIQNFIEQQVQALSNHTRARACGQSDIHAANPLYPDKQPPIPAEKPAPGFIVRVPT